MIPGLPAQASIAVEAILGATPGVRQAVVYGSRAKGNFRPGSDVDICLDAPGLSLSQLGNLEDRIDDLYLPWKFDLTVRQKIADPALLEHIDRVGVVLERGS
ncbi:MAG: nucleotidyltransferase domain-containing protein [Spirochaetales bacterium]